MKARAVTRWTQSGYEGASTVHGMAVQGSVCIEIASVSDLPELVELLQELFRQEADFVPSPERQLRALRSLIAPEGQARVLVAKRGGHCVGMVSLLTTISTAEGGPCVWLEDLIVARELRGEGIGSQLLEAAVEDCRARQIPRITLLTDCDNLSAQGLYARHGFVRSGMIPMRLHLVESERVAT